MQPVRKTNTKTNEEENQDKLAGKGKVQQASAGSKRQTKSSANDNQDDATKPDFSIFVVVFICKVIGW